MKPNTKILVSTLLLSLLAGCSNSKSGSSTIPFTVNETEPNNVPSLAQAVALGGFGHGTVPDNTDTDFWKISLTGGTMVSFQVFANRVDQATWTAGGNAAQLTVFDTDATTVLLRQSDETFLWAPDQDTDIALFMVPATGTYYLKLEVATASTGGEYLFSVRTMNASTPVQSELEAAATTGANDTFMDAEPVVPGTIAGFHVDNESDFYTFTVTEASLVTFTTYGHRNGEWKGDTYYDPEINLYDSGMGLLVSDDDSFYLDSSIHYVITTPGTYYLEVTECCAAGDSGYFVDFTMDPVSGLNPVMETEPNDDVMNAQVVQFDDSLMGNIGGMGDTDDYFALACNAGDRVYVQVFDSANYQDATGNVTVTIEDATPTVIPFELGSGGLQLQRTILPATGTYYVHVTSGVQTDYALHFTQVPAGYESEPNDVIASASSFDLNGCAAGKMDAASDIDTFTFQATAGVPVFLNALASTATSPNGYFEYDGFGSNMEPVINVRDDMGTLLGSSDSTFGNAVGVLDGISSVSLIFLPTTTGTYYAEVVDQGGLFGDDYTYVLEMH